MLKDIYLECPTCGSKNLIDRVHLYTYSLVIYSECFDKKCDTSDYLIAWVIRVEWNIDVQNKERYKYCVFDTTVCPIVNNFNCFEFSDVDLIRDALDSNNANLKLSIVDKIVYT